MIDSTYTKNVNPNDGKTEISNSNHRLTTATYG